MTGLESVQINPHGDTSLVGDLDCEKAVIDTFREEKIPVRFISELDLTMLCSLCLRRCGA